MKSTALKMAEPSSSLVVHVAYFPEQRAQGAPKILFFFFADLLLQLLYRSRFSGFTSVSYIFKICFQFVYHMTKHYIVNSPHYVQSYKNNVEKYKVVQI